VSRAGNANPYLLFVGVSPKILTFPSRGSIRGRVAATPKATLSTPRIYRTIPACDVRLRRRSDSQITSAAATDMSASAIMRGRASHLAICLNHVPVRRAFWIVAIVVFCLSELRDRNTYI